MSAVRCHVCGSCFHSTGDCPELSSRVRDEFAALRARVDELEGAIQAKCLGCDAYWLCRTIDTPPDCPLYPYRGGE